MFDFFYSLWRGGLDDICFAVFIGATALQVGYWLFVFSGLSSPIADLQEAPPEPFSILICARNEAENLRRNLPLILEQQYPAPVEIVLVDDDSQDDDTADFLTRLRLTEAQKARGMGLQILFLKNKTSPGKKAALEAAIKASSFNNLLLTDADCRPASPRWLSQMAAALLRNPPTEIVLGYGPVAKTRGPLNAWARFETFHTALLYLSFARAGFPYMGVGRNLAIKKAVFERAGGFAAHKDLASGDDDLLVNAASTGANTAVCLHPEAFVYTGHKAGFGDWLRQKRRHVSTGVRYRRNDQIRLLLYHLSQSLHYLTGLTSAMSGFGMVNVLLLYGFRQFLILLIGHRICRNLAVPELHPWLPVTDAISVAYYGAIVPIFLIEGPRRGKW